MRRLTFPTWPLLGLFLAALACSREGDSTILYVTATSARATATLEPELNNPFLPTITPSGPTSTPIIPTPNPTRPPKNITVSYTVQDGDTLASIASIYGITVEMLIKLNPSLTATTVIFPKQVINVPDRPVNTTPNFKIIPDSELVNSPAARGFDVAQYIRFQPGFIRIYSESVGGKIMTGAEIVQFLATANSINPRILLALIEFRGGWISNPAPPADQIDYPLGYHNESKKGLFKQLSWAADWLNDGYYGWKYRGLTTIQFIDKSQLAFSPDLNAGSTAVQYFLAQTADRAAWQAQVSPAGFFATYMIMFGDPFRYAIEPLIPPGLVQPTMQFPFPQKETWFYTGGPHGGWDGASGWAAIDFAPPKPPDDLVAAQGNCYISPFTATAMAGGLIVRSGDGAVVIDTDLDGDERTGWTILYLHIAAEDSIKAGTLVQPGTPIGHPSCQGFDLNAVATHLHIARRYNGEWMPADCWACASDTPAPPMVLSGWRVRGLPNQIYQGTMEKQGEPLRRAEQGRDITDNQVTW